MEYVEITPNRNEQIISSEEDNGITLQYIIYLQQIPHAI